MEKSLSIKEIATALCNFQGSIAKIIKTETNPFFKSKYADLPAILDSIREPLKDNGLSFVQFPSGEHALTTLLMHTSGEWIQDTFSMTPAKNDPQGLGSVITYQRRYALGAILGLSIDEDDDANAACAPKVSDSRPFMTEDIYRKILNRISNGEDIYDKAVETYRMKGEYAKGLSEANNFAKKMA